MPQYDFTTGQTASGVVDKSLFDANTILKADTDNTPEALTIAEQRLIGRITSGVITALTAAQVKTLLAIDHGSDVTGLSDDDHPHYLLRSFMNGSFKETFDATVVSSGGVITMSIEKTGTGDLTMQFSDGLTTFDTTPAATITLTAGSDTSPQANWIYILQSSKALTKSTSAWPTAEHIKVAFFFCQSAASMETAGGPIINQNWNDFLEDGNNIGHLLHIVEKVRLLDATYFSGIDGNGTTGYLTITAGNVELKSTSGVIYQLHKHTFPAFDTTGSGDTVHVKNWSGDAYKAITNLHDIVADSGGNAIGTNKWFNIVIWGVQNKSGEHQTIMINLPSGFYNTQTDAENDVSGYDDFSMPREFSIDSSVGFLIARITVKKAGTWVYGSTVDLRGTNPQTASGTAAGIITSFADNVFNIFDESDNTKLLAFDVGTNVSTGTTRTVKAPNASGNIALTSQTDGAIDHGADLAGLGDDDHTQYIRHALATAANDFLVASGSGVYVKKTLAETGAILEADLDHGSIQGLGDDDHTQYMLNSVANANSMLYSVSDNTPAALAMAASRIPARLASGNIVAATGAEILALLSGANLDVGAYDVRGATLTADGLTSGRVVFAGASGLLSDDSDFLFSVDTLTVTKIGAFTMAGGISAAVNSITNIGGFSITAGHALYTTADNQGFNIRGGVNTGGKGATISLWGVDHAVTGRLELKTPNVAKDTDIPRLYCSGNIGTAVWTFLNSTIEGIITSDIDINGGAIDGVTITDPTINGTIATTGLTLPTITVNGGVDITTVNGVDYTPGSDTNCDIATIAVTGTPRFYWWEIGDQFVFTKTLATDAKLTAGSGQTCQLDSIQTWSNRSTFAINLRVSSGSATHKIALQLDGNEIITAQAIGDGAGGITDKAIGFYGSAPQTLQTGVAVSAAGVHAALVNLGLITA